MSNVVGCINKKEETDTLDFSTEPGWLGYLPEKLMDPETRNHPLSFMMRFLRNIKCIVLFWDKIFWILWLDTLISRPLKGRRQSLQKNRSHSWQSPSLTCVQDFSEIGQLNVIYFSIPDFRCSYPWKSEGCILLNIILPQCLVFGHLKTLDSCGLFCHLACAALTLKLLGVAASWKCTLPKSWCYAWPLCYVAWTHGCISH